MRDVLLAFLEESRSGRRGVLCTIVRASGSTPRGIAARMLVCADGTLVGTIGGGAFEAMVASDARALLARPVPAPEVRRYVFTEQGEDALGMACGGTAEVLLEAAAAGPRLLIFGAGHVGLALARLAGQVGFHCDLVDDREEFCAAAEKAGAGRVFRCDPEYREGVPEIDADAYVAIVTRCHRTDRLALKRVLSAPAAYVGLIGSRRKKAVIFRELTEKDGVAARELERVRCPIGLPIGGESPEEIAVSIVAELQQHRYKAGHSEF